MIVQLHAICVISDCDMSEANELLSDLDKSRQSWALWQDEAIPGAGEQRDTAIARMEHAFAHPNEELDFSGLSLTSLPPHIPLNKGIIIDKEMLEEFINVTLNNLEVDTVVEDCVDNFLNYFFEEEFEHEVQADHLDLVSTILPDREIDEELLDNITAQFVRDREDIKKRVKEDLIEFMHFGELPEKENKLEELRAILVISLEDEYCEATEKFGGGKRIYGW